MIYPGFSLTDPFLLRREEFYYHYGTGITSNWPRIWAPFYGKVPIEKSHICERLLFCVNQVVQSAQSQQLSAVASKTDQSFLYKHVKPALNS